MRHTFSGPNNHVLSANIYIHKPVVKVLNGQEQTVSEWTLESVEDHDTGRIYTKKSDRVMMKKVFDMISETLSAFDTEELYYSAITM